MGFSLSKAWKKLRKPLAFAAPFMIPGVGAAAAGLIGKGSMALHGALQGTSALGIAKELAPSAIGFLGQQQTNVANAKQASQQMAFQERMSNTAHQRARQDLLAAGINPILAGTNPASSPGGAMATMGNSAEAGRQAYLQHKMQKEQIANIGSQTGVNKNQAGLIASQNINQQEQRKLIVANARQAAALADLTEIDRDFFKNNPKARWVRALGGTLGNISTPVGAAAGAAAGYLGGRISGGKKSSKKK